MRIIVDHMINDDSSSSERCDMKQSRRSIILFFLLFAAGLMPLFAGEKLIAYPVPFDPLHETLSLMYEPVRSAGSVHVEIFDVNGSLVLARDYSSINSFKWKGYNGEGRRVANGLYIIKTRWEDAASGQVRTNVVRITVVQRKR